MIAQFEDYCLWMYVVVDEVWPRVTGRYRCPGPAPACSDSELVTMALVGESRGWDQETDLVREWRARRDLFPESSVRPQIISKSHVRCGGFWGLAQSSNPNPIAATTIIMRLFICTMFGR